MPRIPAKRVRIDPIRGDVWAPLVLVRITLPSGAVDLPALIDSGSDNTVLPIEAVAGLGVTWAGLPAGTQGQGAGGAFEKRILKAEISYDGRVVCDEVEVAQPNALPVVLLGRNDFFKRFRVTLDWTVNAPWIELEALDPPAMTRQQRRAQERLAQRR